MREKGLSPRLKECYQAQSKNALTDHVSGTRGSFWYAVKADEIWKLRMCKNKMKRCCWKMSASVAIKVHSRL